MIIRRKIFVFLATLMGVTGCGADRGAGEAVPQAATQSAIEQPASEPALAAINIGMIDSLDSEILGETRDLWIYLPESAKREENANATYPVVYLLDGNGHFHSVTGMIRQLSTVNGNSELPEMIVVGIPNTDRLRDLTPSHTEGSSGGGKEFLGFIESELIPYIDATYPVNSYRTFIGHSLGGLTVIDALFTMPESFQNFVAIDPSLWWDDQLLLKKSEAMLNELNLNGKSLYVAAANTTRGRIGYDEVREDSDPSTVHMRSILEFTRIAEAENGNGLNFSWGYYDDDSHGSVPLIAEYDAFRFMFSWHSRIDLVNSLNLDPSSSAEQLSAMVEQHFDTVSVQLGYPVIPPERFINGGANNFLGSDRPEVALAFLNMNLQNYPQSANTHEALSDYYQSQEELEQAVQHLNHAIAIDDSPERQEKLGELLSDN